LRTLYFILNKDLTRKKRQVSPFEIANSPSVSGMGGFTASGAMIGSAFGPIGLAVGAGIGVIVDVVCAIVCRKYCIMSKENIIII
jgi:hypothetical protein